MEKVGRPTKVSTDLAKRIANLLLQGVTEKQAAEASGLDAASFFDYMKKGASGDPLFLEFRRIVEEAKLQRKTWEKPAPVR